MEFPIKIIVVLFITLIVAVSLITFSNQVINNSKRELDNFRKESDESKIIELTTINSYQIAAMAKECYDKHSNINLRDELCFALLGEVNADSNTVKEESMLNDKIEVDLSNAKNAVKISYDAIRNMVMVTE